MFNECPYKSSNGCKCAHRATKINRKGKRYCGHPQASNCDLYKEWLSNKENVKIKGSKPLEVTKETQDD